MFLELILHFVPNFGEILFLLLQHGHIVVAVLHVDDGSAVGARFLEFAHLGHLFERFDQRLAGLLGNVGGSAVAARRTGYHVDSFFFHRRHVREQLVTFLGHDRQRAQVIGFDLRESDADVVEADIDLFPHRCLPGRTVALERNHLNFQP